MRIAFLTFEFPDARPGGVGSYTLKCARALAASGHEPHIFTLAVPQSARRMLPAGVHLHEVRDVAQRVESGALPGALAAVAMMGTQATYKLLVGTLLCDALRSEHQAHPFDIVEAAECEGLALPLIMRPMLNLPVVVQIHLGYAANSFGNGVGPEERDHLAEAYELASIVGADAICAATQGVVDVTRKLCPFSREAEIIPYPVECPATQDISPAPADGAALFVGRLQRRKGCAVLASAADIFLRRNPGATVRIAGSDTRIGANGQSMLEQMIASIDPSLRGRFIYLGELSQQDLAREIDACRFQVVPSVVENFANTAVDAMARGRLILYGGDTGLDEVVGDAGIRVWPLAPAALADQMEFAWRNSEAVESYGHRAVERVRTRFDPMRVSTARIKFYERVISGNAVPVRQWDALSGPQIQEILRATISQMSVTVGLPPDIPTPGSLLTARLTAMAARLKRPPKVWLFGAGRFTLRLLGERHRWESLGLSLAGIVDDHQRFAQSPDWLGFTVKSPEALCGAIGQGLGVDAIILSTDTLQAVFRERTECFVKLGIEVSTL